MRRTDGEGSAAKAVLRTSPAEPSSIAITINPKTTVDLSETIIPKSDQLNADDLIAGPLDITITSVERGSREQPVIIHYEGEAGRPYKPSKGMRRVIVKCYGKESSAYVGKSLRLYRDDSVKFGGEAVGGIRISHASHITEPTLLALTVTRGKRTQYQVEPLPKLAAHQPAWNDVADDRIQYLREEAEECATTGTEALREFWRKLNAAERTALTPDLEKWKQWAADADAGDDVPDFPLPATQQPETANELPL